MILPADDKLAVIRCDNSCIDIVEPLSTVSSQARVFDMITLARSHLGVSLSWGVRALTANH